MPNFQNNINRTIDTGAVLAGLYSQTDRSKALQASITSKGLSKQAAKLKGNPNLYQKELAAKLSSSAQSQADKAVELSPSESRIKTAVAARQESMNLSEEYELAKGNAAEAEQQRYEQEIAQEEANAGAIVPLAVSQQVGQQANNRAGTTATVQGAQASNYKSRLEEIKNMSVEDGREFLRAAQHIQAMKKRNMRRN